MGGTPKFVIDDNYYDEGDIVDLFYGKEIQDILERKFRELFSFIESMLVDSQFDWFIGSQRYTVKKLIADNFVPNGSSEECEFLSIYSQLTNTYQRLLYEYRRNDSDCFNILEDIEIRLQKIYWIDISFVSNSRILRFCHRITKAIEHVGIEYADRVAHVTCCVFRGARPLFDNTKETARHVAEKQWHLHQRIVSVTDDDQREKWITEKQVKIFHSLLSRIR